MRRNLEWLGVALTWCALLVQFVLMLVHREVGVVETVARFFTFFTITTNALVAVFFTSRALGRPNFFTRPASQTAITAFILVVGIVYQIVLRPIWSPTGLDRVVDELLHTVIPAFTLLYFLLYPARVKSVRHDLLPWLAYPLLYLIVVIIHGAVGGFYPYPFVDVTRLGYPAVLRNALLISLFALILVHILLLYTRRRDRSPV